MEEEASKRTVELLKEINHKLSVILGELIREKDQPIKKQIRVLHSAGFNYNTVSEILGISRSHAAKELTHIKRKKGDVK